jgi:hypothetical protein
MNNGVGVGHPTTRLLVVFELVVVESVILGVVTEEVTVDVIDNSLPVNNITIKVNFSHHFIDPGRTGC